MVSSSNVCHTISQEVAVSIEEGFAEKRALIRRIYIADGSIEVVSSTVPDADVPTYEVGVFIPSLIDMHFYLVLAESNDLGRKLQEYSLIETTSICTECRRRLAIRRTPETTSQSRNHRRWWSRTEQRIDSPPMTAVTQTLIVASVNVLMDVSYGVRSPRRRRDVSTR